MGFFTPAWLRPSCQVKPYLYIYISISAKVTKLCKCLHGTSVNTSIFLPGESHCVAEHHGRVHLQIRCHVCWTEADGSSRGEHCPQLSVTHRSHAYIYILNCHSNSHLFLFSFFQSWWETSTTVAALTLRSSTRSTADYDPNWPSRYFYIIFKVISFPVRHFTCL